MDGDNNIDAYKRVGGSGSSRKGKGRGKRAASGQRQESRTRRKQARGTGSDRRALDGSSGGGRKGGSAHAQLFGQYSAATLWGGAAIGFVCGFATLFGGYGPFGILAVTVALFGVGHRICNACNSRSFSRNGARRGCIGCNWTCHLRCVARGYKETPVAPHSEEF